jgi:hypothetical protein
MLPPITLGVSRQGAPLKDNMLYFCCFTSETMY